MRRAYAGTLGLVSLLLLTGFQPADKDLINAFGWGYGDASLAGKQAQDLAIQSAQMSLSIFLSARPIPFTYDRVRGVPQLDVKLGGELFPDAGVTVQEVPGGILARADWQRSAEEIAALRPFDMKTITLETPWTADGIPWRDAIQELVDAFYRPCRACRMEGVVILASSSVDLDGRELNVKLTGHVKVGKKSKLAKDDQLEMLRDTGALYAKEKRWPDAVGALRKAASLSPKDVSTHAALARVGWQAGLVDTAKEALEKLVEIDPETPKWKNHLEMVSAGKTWAQAREALLLEHLGDIKGKKPDWVGKKSWVEKKNGAEVWHGVGKFKLPKPYTELSLSQLQLSLSVAHNRARAELAKLDEKAGDGSSAPAGVEITVEYLEGDNRTFWALATWEKP